MRPSDRRVRVAIATFAFSVLPFCGGKASDAGSSESHFLAPCVDTCHGGLECICGVCTRACTADDACGDLSSRASCLPGCTAADESVCGVECAGDDPCRALGASFECVAGQCRPAERSGGSGGHAEGGDDSGSGVAFRCDDADVEAANRVADAVQAADTACTSSADCVAIQNSTLCHHACGAVVSLEGAASVQAVIDELNAGLCASFEKAGCRAIVPPCPPQGDPECIDGACRLLFESGGGGDAGALYTCVPEELNPPGNAPMGSSCCGGFGTCTAPQALGGDPAAHAYGHDTCVANLVCAPFDADGGTFLPCTAAAGDAEIEGRCMPQCFVRGDAEQLYITEGDCPPTLAGEPIVCAPCFSPVDASPTGFCARGEDSPALPAPAPLSECGVFPPGARPEGLCLPEALIALTDGSTEGVPVDTCSTGSFCVPARRVREPNTCFSHCEAYIEALALRAPGACIPRYAAEADMAGASELMARSTCDEGEVCAPCISPIDNMPTGACSE